MEERVSPWRGVIGVLALAVAVGALTGAIAGASVALLVNDGDSTPEPASTEEAAGPTSLLRVTEESAITDTFNKVSPGVVTLVVQAQTQDQQGRTVRETNLGSGVIIDDRGYA
jgi:S1-C subfamily serine protease